MEGGRGYGLAAPLSNAHPRLAGTLLLRPLHARPHSVLDLLAGCAAHSRWRLLHDDQPELPAGDLLLDSPVWHRVIDRFVLERRGTDIDPRDAAL